MAECFRRLMGGVAVDGVLHPVLAERGQPLGNRLAQLAQAAGVGVAGTQVSHLVGRRHVPLRGKVLEVARFCAWGRVVTITIS